MYDENVLKNAAQEILNYSRYRIGGTLAQGLTDVAGRAIDAAQAAASARKTSEAGTTSVLPSQNPTETQLAISNAASAETLAKKQQDDNQAAAVGDKKNSTIRYYDGNSGAPKISAALKISNSIVNAGAASDRLDSPQVAFEVHLDDSVSTTVRDVDVVAAFCSGIPTLEMSRCVPYVDLSIVSFADGPDKASQRITLPSFIRQEKGALETLADNFATAIPSNLASLGGQAASFLGIQAGKGFTVAGMEIFTSPQTLVNPESNVGINRFLPFLTLESINVNVVSANQGFFSYKQAAVKLVLHDRSRLGDIASLVAVDLFSQNHVILEYGWSHPDGSIGSGNVFGRLLNNLRVRETYSVTSTNVNMSSDNGGAVSIDLKLTHMPGDQMRAVSAAAGEFVQLDLVRSALSALAVKNTVDKNPDVNNKIRIKSRNIMSPATLVRRETLKSLLRNLRSQEGLDNDNFKTEGARVLADLENPADPKTDASVSKQLESKLNGLRDIYKKVDGKSEQDNPPFAAGMSQFLEANQKLLGATPSSVYIPLGAIVYAFAAFPLAASCKFDEVEVHFYPLNSSALFASNKSISDIPVPSEILNKIVLESKSPNCYSLIRAIIDNTVSSSNYFIYGLNNLFEKRKELEKTAKARAPSAADPKKKTEQEIQAEKQFEAEFEATMAAADDDLQDQIETLARQTGSPTGDFIAPDVRVYVESLPIVDGESKTKCRVHIFDKARSPYVEQQTMIRSLSATDIVSTYGSKVGNSNTKIQALGSDLTNAIESSFDRNKMFEIIEGVVPTIRIGTDSTVITRATVSSNTSGALADAFLVETLRNIKDPQISKGSTVSGVQDVTIIPSTLSITMIGMPRINYGQQFLVDLGTGTTLDNIYVVTGLSHNISPDGFVTNVTLSPTFQASFKSFKTSLKSAISTITQI